MRVTHDVDANISKCTVVELTKGEAKDLADGLEAADTTDYDLLAGALEQAISPSEGKPAAVLLTVVDEPATT